MASGPFQQDLFDDSPSADLRQVQWARAYARAQIDRLCAAVEPPWVRQIDIYLDGGAFGRALWLLPPEEAAALRQEFDPVYERLFNAWMDAHLPPEE